MSGTECLTYQGNFARRLPMSSYEPSAAERVPVGDEESARRAADLTGLVVGDELGRGAFTTVHRARRGDDTYALKRPIAESAGDPGLLTAFQREAALLAYIDDLGVPLIHAAGRFAGAPPWSSSTCPGGSLADTLAHGPLAVERVVELAGQLGCALAAAHRVLPDHDGAAPDLAERMRRAVADSPIPTAAGPLPVTSSVGLTQLDPADATLDQLLARADHALYRAKESGRNRVVVC
jgi:hypothetical protein